MSAADLAKDAIKIATTAGLSKDVIDLLEKKLALITEESLFFKDSLSKAIAENEVLKLKISNLEEQLQNLSPQEDRLDKECEEILFLLFETDRRLTIDQVTKHFQLHPSVAKAHFDTLRQKRYVLARSAIVSDFGPSRPAEYELTSEGREYAMKHRKK
jgi:regulator of replication initiation timing